MRRVDAKIVENRREDLPASSDQDQNLGLLKRILTTMILDWERGATIFDFPGSTPKLLKQYVHTRPLHRSYTR